MPTGNGTLPDDRPACDVPLAPMDRVAAWIEIVRGPKEQRMNIDRKIAAANLSLTLAERARAAGL